MDVPYDFSLWLYRRQMNLSWADLTGEWPQPEWRTDQDIWYLGLEGECQAILQKQAAARAAANTGR